MEKRGLIMMEKIKALWTKHREVLMYLIFGAMTTFVGWSVYYAVLLGGRAVFEIPAGETTSARYLALYTAAHIIQWVCAVLFAFFTNRTWVFPTKGKILREMLLFFAARLTTLGVEEVFLLIFATILQKEVMAVKVIGSLLVLVLNYVFSKRIVFRKP